MENYFSFRSANSETARPSKQHGCAPQFLKCVGMASKSMSGNMLRRFSNSADRLVGRWSAHGLIPDAPHHIERRRPAAGKINAPRQRHDQCWWKILENLQPLFCMPEGGLQKKSQRLTSDISGFFNELSGQIERRVGDDGRSEACPFQEKIDTTAHATINKIGRGDFIAMRFEAANHCPITACRLPQTTTRRRPVRQERMSYLVRAWVKIILTPVGRVTSDHSRCGNACDCSPP